MKKDKCSIKIDAEVLENGEVEVTGSYEGPVYLIGTTLSETILNMENTDMHNIYAVFIKAQIERMRGEVSGK